MTSGISLSTKEIFQRAKQVKMLYNTKSIVLNIF